MHGKDILPRIGELSPNVLKPAIAKLLGEPLPEETLRAPLKVFPRPPTITFPLTRTWRQSPASWIPPREAWAFIDRNGAAIL